MSDRATAAQRENADGVGQGQILGRPLSYIIKAFLNSGYQVRP